MPQSADHYERVLTMLRAAETKRELDAALWLYAFDLSYPRPDVLAAERLVCIEKGFR